LVHFFDLWWGEYNWKLKLLVSSCICGVKLVVHTNYSLSWVCGG
jgi:hypothetical protein